MYRIGIDVGGTFTDVVLVDEDTGAGVVAKVLNEPGRKAETVVRGVQQVLADANISPKQVSLIGHGTTIATNAVLERKGARSALVTNKGFRDVLEIGRFSRPPGGADAPGGWWILFEPELHFGSDVVVPDIAGWRRTSMAVLPNVAFFEQAPDWICEVVSPSTGRVDRGRKMRIYAREKVAHLWMVDPIIRTLEVYRLEDDRWIVAGTHAGNDVVHAEPFDAVELDLSRWWLD